MDTPHHADLEVGHLPDARGEAGRRKRRARIAARLLQFGQDFSDGRHAEPVVGPGMADAVVADTDSSCFIDCPACGGMLKPDIVYFGESVAKEVVDQAYSLVDAADALLVAPRWESRS